MSENEIKKQKLNKNILVIVLTGGPCGGKTTSLIELKECLQELGYKIFTVPEVSTILLSNGAKYPGENNKKDLLTYESHLLQLVINLQKTFYGIASIDTKQKTVILCDRGTLDVKAYMPNDIWEEVLLQLNENEESLLSCYDLICHLTTAASGADEFYSSQSNVIRSENLQQAQQLDKKTLNCWANHSNHIIIDNPKEGGFNKKLENLKNYIINYVSSHKFNEE